MAEKPNGGRDDFKTYDDDLGRQYVIQNAPVYTLTPGDFVRDETDGNQKDYKIVSVGDVDEIDNTYYIYRVKTLRKRIYNQQDGIYYLTALRGDFAPSVSEFNSFKFGHPTERLYPELFADDPLWFDPNGDGQTVKDAPATISVADNYVHGLVVADDNKNSITREATENLLTNIGRFGGSDPITVGLAAMDGKAVASREDRVIGIEGDSNDVADRRFYVELRRPSQARSGNHTFEYTGFGPGNYSTAFPSRQEYVLSDDEVLFSQAKRQDGGVVFYSGLNANGDLFVGNQRINAISGEETKIDDSILRVAGENVDEEENTNDLTVDTLTVNKKVKFALSADFEVAALGGTKFTSPVEIELAEDPFANSSDDKPALLVKSVGNIGNPNVDPTLTTTDLGVNPVFKPNSIAFAQWIINPRNETSGVKYVIKTSTDKTVPASESFKEEGTIELRGTQTVGEAHRIANVNYNTSLGWIYTQLSGWDGGAINYGWREWGLIGTDALTTYTTGSGSTANDPGDDMRLGVNLRNVRTTNSSVIPTQTLDVEGSGIFRNSLWVGGDNLNPTGAHTLRVFDDDGNGVGRVHVNGGDDGERQTITGLWVGGDAIIRGSGAGTAPVESVGGGHSGGNLTIDGTFTALSNGSHEMVGDLTVTKDLYVRGGNMQMYQLDSGTDLRIDVQQANTAADNNYITAHGQNIVIGDAIWSNDHFDDASTAKLVALADGSARIGDSDGGIQMTDTSMVSIGAASPDIAQRLWVKGSTKIELDGAELLTVYNQTTPRLTMNKDGRIDLVGSGSLTDPTGRWDANGALSIGQDFLIAKTHINDDVTYTIDSQTGNTVIGNDTDNSGTLIVHSNTNSSDKDTGAVIISDGGLGVEGNINAGGDINAGGNISSASGGIDINNGGSNNFKVNTDGSIDINQVTGYFTPTGGRKWVGVSVDGDLEANTNYYVTTFGAATLTLTLPSAPQKGDEIRILDTTDALTYNKAIVIQTPQGGGSIIPVQGDTQGQLVIQTPGAGLGLVYLTAGIGWRLIEL